MAGGIYRQPGRKTWRVWVSWNGSKIFVNKYLDGTPLYSEEQARRVLERIRSEIDQRVFDPASWGKDKVLLFKNAWTLYQDQSEVSPGRIKGRDMIYRTYLEAYWKDFCLRDIEEPHISKWFSELPAGLAPSYRCLIKVTLKAFFNHFSLTRRKLFKFPSVTVPKKAAPWLTKEEQDLVLEFIKSRYQGIIQFIMAYGCRPSEACNLRKADIDWQVGTITFKDRKNAEDNLLPILPQIREVLTAPRKVESMEYAFCTSSGGKVNPQGISNAWLYANRKASKKYGVKIVPLKNGTRHSLASQLRNRGVSLSDIARILGNTEAIVERNYGRVSVSRVAEVMALKREGENNGIPESSSNLRIV